MKNIKHALIALALAAAATAFVSVCSADATNPPGNSTADDKLFNELSSRGMDELLDRAFDQAKTPEDQRQSIKTVASLARLTNDPQLTPEKRAEAIKDVVSAIDKLLAPIQNDAPKLISLAQTISGSGIDHSVAVLEYWGDSETERAKLKPLAQAVVKIYDLATKAADAQVKAVENKINSPNDPAAVIWQKMQDLSAGAQYQMLRNSYALALALEKTDPARAKLIDAALDPNNGLAKWDNGDSGIQATVRLLIAKLNLLKGDFDTANKVLDSLIKNDAADIQPIATDGQVFEARCVKVVAALQEEKVADADAALKIATTQPLATDRQNAPILKLLNYRILALKADKAAPGKEKDLANEAAVKELGNLTQEFPELRKLIFDQYLARLPANPDYAKLDPVFLEAMMQKGRQIVVTLKPDKLDAQNKLDVEHAHAAAEEIIKRGVKSFDKSVVVEASLLHGIFHEFRGEKLQAVDALLDHIDRFGSDPSAKIEFALDHAEELIVELRKASPVDAHGNKDPEVARVEERFMKMAINSPFNRKEFALQYASQLFKQQKWMEAVKYYRLVPDTSPASDLLRARYGEMISLKSELDDNAKLTTADKGVIVSRIQALAGLIQPIADGIVKTSQSETEKTYARSTLARTSLTAADITRREQKDPKKVLELLQHFEDSVVGLPDAKDLLNIALFARVQSYMQLGQTNDATASLVEYLKSAGANEGASTVHDLLDTLNKELDKARADAEAARAANDATAVEADDKVVRQIADNRAVLSKFLVDWATTNNDPKIKAYAYTYRRFAADTERLAASLEVDPDLRKKKLSDAVADYKALLTPDNVTLYRATLPPDKPGENTNATADDLSVTLGMGLIDYDLQDWKEVVNSIGPMIAAGKLGEDNDQVWEATYKLLDAMHQLSKTGDLTVTDAQVATSLKLLYLNWREDTGGKKYHDKFESLRKDVIPNWKLDATAAAK